jgi:chromosome segregation ATPase
MALDEKHWILAGRIALRRLFEIEISLRMLTERKTNMSTTRTCHLFKLIAVVFFTLCATQFTAAQNNKQIDDKETLQELLGEVRMLRQAMQNLQRMGLDSYQSQLLVDRIRVNREDSRRLSESLNDTRDQLMRTQRAIPNYADQTKLIETQLQMEADPGKKAQLEYESKRTRDTIEEYKSRVDSLKEREQSLVNELRNAQTKLDELESRLDVLERSIENDRQKLDKEAPRIKTP